MTMIPNVSSQGSGGLPPLARWQRLALAALFLASAILFLGNLGSSSLWQDEAQTALIAKTVLQGALPRGTDGINFFSQELGAEYGPRYIWRWHTWLPFYVLAGFFKLFGASTVVARLPFALAGWLCVGALYALCIRLYRRRTVALCAAILLALCMQHLLLSRQCRYYSFTALFSLLGLHGYLLIVLTPGQRRGHLLLITAAVLLFHTHYIYLVTLLGTIFLHCAVFYRGALPQVLIAGAIPTVLNVPWVVWLASMEYPAGYTQDMTSTTHLQHNLMGFVLHLLLLTFPPSLLLATGACVVAALRRRGRPAPQASPAAAASNLAPTQGPSARAAVALLGLYLIGSLLVLSVVSPGTFFRYLAPLLPPACAMLALPVSQALSLHPLVGPGLLLVLVLRGPMPLFLHELTHKHRGPITGIVEHLKKEGRPGQIVAITYGDLPLKFYTQMRVIGGLTGEDLSLAPQADWVIIRHHVNCEKDKAVAEALRARVPWERYQRVVLDVADSAFENRESMPEHYFRSPTLDEEPPVVIYRRRPQRGSPGVSDTLNRPGE